MGNAVEPGRPFMNDRVVTRESPSGLPEVIDWTWRSLFRSLYSSFIIKMFL
jgi:hypothetical protein